MTTALIHRSPRRLAAVAVRQSRLTAIRVTRHEEPRSIESDSAHDAEPDTDHRWIRAETPITPDDPEIPDEPPPPDEGAPEVDDQPLGPPADLPAEDAPLPGLPEREPPAAD